MLLLAHSNPLSGTKDPLEVPTAPSQTQAGLNTLPQRALRKDPATPSALVLMSRSNTQPTGNADVGGDLAEQTRVYGEGARRKMSRRKMS